MTLTLATADSDPVGKAIGAAIVVVVVLMLWHVIACWLWPFGPCRWCSGTGRWHQPLQDKKKRRRNFRRCSFCKGSGRRLRLGRRFYNVFHAAKDNAKKGP